MRRRNARAPAARARRSEPASSSGESVVAIGLEIVRRAAECDGERFRDLLQYGLPFLRWHPRALKVEQVIGRDVEEHGADPVADLADDLLVMFDCDQLPLALGQVDLQQL